jgi:hypothetical protein
MFTIELVLRPCLELMKETVSDNPLQSKISSIGNHKELLGVLLTRIIVIGIVTDNADKYAMISAKFICRVAIQSDRLLDMERKHPHYYPAQHQES